MVLLVVGVPPGPRDVIAWARHHYQPYLVGVLLPDGTELVGRGALNEADPNG